MSVRSPAVLSVQWQAGSISRTTHDTETEKTTAMACPTCDDEEGRIGLFLDVAARREGKNVLQYVTLLRMAELVVLVDDQGQFRVLDGVVGVEEWVAVAG